jgi:4-hydroxyphenylpyruvate dioxygenase
MAITAERLSSASRAPAPTLLGFDHLEWWVGNARHSAHFFVAAFGFEVVAYAGPETGLRDRQSYVLRQGDICFVVTSALDDCSDLAWHVRMHGDGVRTVAYRVADVAREFDRAVARGGRAAGDATIAAYGDTVHTLVARKADELFPRYEATSLAVATAGPIGLTTIDHVVANVDEGDLDEWVAWYEQVWGLHQLQHFSEDAISTEYSALRSTVVSNGGRVVQPINEPAPGRKRSQIEEFLDYYGSPGVQHIAMRTDDIVATVAALRDRGVRTLRVPPAYYDEAPGRIGEIGAGLPWARLAELGILVDRDADGFLLQVFTEPVASRPTVFVEIIQRCGAHGFGEGNFKALFTSIEAEQARRGNL